MKHGFSLVELSIVLVILGLLTGGILAGRSLIRASELRKVVTDLDKYRSTAFAFKEKYFYFPGDLPNAASFWPSTSNGDGNGKIYATGETTKFWQHLSLSGMVEGTYDGVWDASGYTPPGTNAAAMPFANGVYIVESAVLTSQSWSIYQNMDNHFHLGAGVNGTTGVLTGADAWTLDTKMDDGNAQSGKVYGYWGADPATGVGAGAHCVNSSNTNPPDPTKSYNLTDSMIACNLFYFF